MTSTSAPGTDDSAGRPDELAVLVCRMRQGDTAAFARFYDLTAGSVYGVAFRVLRDRAVAEDVAQEVLVESWRGSSLFDPARGSALTWVMTIAHRRAVQRVRRDQSRSDHAAHIAQDAKPPAGMGEGIGPPPGCERVRARVDQLSDPQRGPLSLAYYDGYTLSEIMRMLDAPPGLVETRIRDAVSRLRDH